jgi:methenyltetrahydromethanopterin cyclohydrolase
MENLSVNQEALRIVEKVLREAGRLGVSASRLDNGATVIDMGQQVPGSWLAGKYYAEITMGGLGGVAFETFQLDEYVLPAVRVTSAHPLLAGWVCQKHADPLAEDESNEQGGGVQPILTGPAKALLHPRDESVVLARYEDDSSVAVASFQTDEPITEPMAETVAEACRIRTQDLTIIVAPTTSLVCAIQVAARPIDQVMHRLHEEGFDIHAVRYVTGRAPIPPLTTDEPMAMGRINDSLLYGGSVLLYVEGEDEAIERMVPLLPTSALSEYGKPFAQIYEEHDYSFHKMDPRLHSLALVQINNLTTGRSLSAGTINRQVLRESFFGDG